VIHLKNNDVMLVMHPTTIHILLVKKDATYFKLYEIQGRRVCLNMKISIGAPCVLGVGDKAIIDDL